MSARILWSVAAVVVVAFVSMTAGATSLGRVSLGAIYDRIEYIGIVRVVRVPSESSGVARLVEVAQVEAIKGDRAGSGFTVMASAADLVPDADRLLVVITKPDGPISPAVNGMQWVFPVEMQGDDQFVFAARDNVFFQQEWLSSNEGMQFFVVEKDRIVAAMKLSTVRRLIDCARAEASSKVTSCSK